MKKAAIIVAVVLLVLYLIAGYFIGGLPVASKVMGSNKPVDLGIEISVDGAYQGLDAMGQPTTVEELQEIVDNPDSFGTVQTTLTEEEASSLMALNNAPDFPARLTQIKFNDNGTMESSGIIWLDKFPAFLARNGVSSEGIEKVMGYIGFMDSTTYYIKGTFSISNNNVDLDMDSVKVGRINIPTGVINDNRGSVENTVSNILTNNGYNIRSLYVSDGKVNVDMDQPLGSIVPWLHYVQS